MINNKLLQILIPSKNISSGNLKPEESICVEFANAMRQKTLENKLPYIWFHVPNEFLPSPKINYSFDLRQKHMGKMSGVPDYVFMSYDDSFFIEFKACNRNQTRNQKIFEDWCATQKVPYFLCRSAKEGIDLVLKRSEIIR